MKRSWLKPYWCIAALALVGLVLTAGCDDVLPANFWADKTGEIVNRSIFGVINAALAALTGGGIQI